MSPKAAHPRALIGLADRYVSNAFDADLLKGTRIDLYRLAEARAIHTVEFRPLLADGCLLVDNGGFSVQINDPHQATVTVGAYEDGRKLNVKQRFTFAHEIAHTLPYDTTRVPPRPKDHALKLIAQTSEKAATRGLEDFCQIAASLMLVPTAGLKRKDVLGRLGRVDSIGSVLRLAEIFDVSPDVIIHRVADSGETEGIKAPYFALIMVRDVNGEGQVRAYIYSPTLAGIADPPKLYSRIATWIKRTPLLKNVEILTAEAHEWKKRTPSGTVRIVKRPYGGQPGSYFLELNYDPI